LFDNRSLRRLLGPKGDGVTGEWRKLHNEKFTDLSPSPNINQVIKSIKMRWVGHIARTRESRGAYRILVGKPEGKRPLEDSGVDGRVILKSMLKKWDVGHGP
jgi:hypothetical protein